MLDWQYMPSVAYLGLTVMICLNGATVSSRWDMQGVRHICFHSFLSAWSRCSSDVFPSNVGLPTVVCWRTACFCRHMLCVWASRIQGINPIAIFTPLWHWNLPQITCNMHFSGIWSLHAKLSTAKHIAPVLLSSKLNKIFVGYFDPENIFLGNESK